MTKQQKDISFLNKYFIFKKIRNVDINDIKIGLLQTTDQEQLDLAEEKLMPPLEEDTVPEPIDTAPEPIDTAPEPIDTIPKPIAPIDTIPEPIDTIPEPIDTIAPIFIKKPVKKSTKIKL